MNATAEDRCSALSVAASRAIDLLVSDVDLPDGDGCKVMEAVRRLYAVRGIAVTGHTTEDVRARCMAEGFLAVLVKPVMFETLADALTAACPPRSPP